MINQLSLSIDKDGPLQVHRVQVINLNAPSRLWKLTFDPPIQDENDRRVFQLDVPIYSLKIVVKMLEDLGYIERKI